MVFLYLRGKSWEYHHRVMAAEGARGMACARADLRQPTFELSAENYTNEWDYGAAPKANILRVAFPVGWTISPVITGVRWILFCFEWDTTRGARISAMPVGSAKSVKAMTILRSLPSRSSASSAS